MAWLRGVTADLAMSCRVMMPTEHKSMAMMTIARSTGQIFAITTDTSMVATGTATANTKA